MATVPTGGPAGGEPGEILGVAERVVVAPRAGVFRTGPGYLPATEGRTVTAGEVIGVVAVQGEEAEVRSPFAGLLMGSLVADGERVRAGQPVAWLRTS